jgi:endonuclease/exonuclease/phosphatase family metal-dependent hydrolase
MGGGLLLLSRHRIVASSSTVYRQCAGDDCLANKGALHARINPRGSPCAFDVFLTHTQAAHPTLGGSAADAERALRAQIPHLAAFVRACRDPVGPAVLFGDFNIDSFARPDLYSDLVAALGFPADVLPTVELDGRSRPTGTSESDDHDVSSFQSDHAARAADDPQRFGDTTERLDYIFSFPGLLYGHHVGHSRVVVEQWEPGRDMSDHYGVETFVDTTVQSLPQERPIRGVRVGLLGFRCLQPTSGPGDDEVSFSLSVLPDLGQGGSVDAPETDDVDAGTASTFDLRPLELRDPGEELDLLVEGREIDSLSADDSLGRARRTFRHDELLALAAGGGATIAMPMLRGDGAEYVIDLEVVVDAPLDAADKKPNP